MSSEQQIEVYRQLGATQDKYVYFLLAASGAAIAFAITQTQTAKLALSQVPLGLAVLIWGASFVFGCRRISYVASTLYANATLLQVKAGQHRKVGVNPIAIAAASEGIHAALEANSDKANRYLRLQFVSLVLGAVCYVSWHVWEMWLRT